MVRLHRTLCGNSLLLARDWLIAGVRSTRSGQALRVARDDGVSARATADPSASLRMTAQKKLRSGQALRVARDGSVRARATADAFGCAQARLFGFAQRLSGLSRVRLLEKRKTVEPFPAFPQPRLLLAEFCEGESRRRCELGAMLTYLASFGVKSDEQFVGYGDADDFGRLAGGAQALLEGDEVRFVPSDHAADDEQDFADCRAASAHRSFSLVLA